MVEPPQRERNIFPEMTEDDFQLRKFIEHAAEDHPQGMRSGFDRVTPRRLAERKVILKISFHHLWMWRAWMQIKRNVQRFGTRRIT